MEQPETMEIADTGFTPIPNDLLNALLASDVNKRELKTILLILRITEGCHTKWAKLRQCDLASARIGANHAKTIIDDLLAREMVLINGRLKQFRINEQYFLSKVPKTGSFELDRLSKLVGRNLPRQTSQNRNRIVPKPVTTNFPKQEGVTSQNGNNTSIPKREVSTSNAKAFSTPKDIIKEKFKNNDKNSVADLIKEEPSITNADPHAYQPSNNIEFVAHEAWKAIEPDNPGSFGFYLWAGKTGLPDNKFGEYKARVMDDPNIQNKGAVFVSLVTGYLVSHGLYRKTKS